MKQIEFEDYRNKWNLSIDKVKIILGKDRYRLYRSLIHHLSKEDRSEFEEENINDLSVKFNNQRFDAKSLKLYLFNMSSNIDDELKLSTKSIFVEYLESRLKLIDYDDEFLMLNQSIDLINQNVLDEISVLEDDVKISFALPKYSFKTLVKNIEGFLYKTEISSKDFDLSINEKFSIYWTTLKYIANENRNKNFLVIISLDSLPNNLYQKMRDIDFENICFIIFAHHLNCSINYQDIYVNGKISIDFADDESIFNNLVIEKGFAVDLESAKEKLIRYCENLNETDKLIDLVY